MYNHVTLHVSLLGAFKRGKSKIIAGFPPSFTPARGLSGQVRIHGNSRP